MKSLKILIAFFNCLFFSTFSYALDYKYVSIGCRFDGCEYITATGVIEPDEKDRFVAFVTNGRNVDYGMQVHLDSPGGSLVGGIELGQYLRAKGHSTHTESGKCFSACAYAFLGGRERSLGEKALYGVHQFYDADDAGKGDLKKYSSNDFVLRQFLTGLIVKYIIDMGVDVRLYTLAATARPNDLRILTPTELAEFNIVHDPAAMKPWQLEPYKEGLTASTASFDGALSVTLGCARRDSQRTVFLKYRDLTKEDAFGLDNLNVVGIRVDGKALSLVAQKDGLGVLVRLPATFDPMKAEVNGKIYIDGSDSSLARPKWAVFYKELPKKQFVEVARLAFRNCY